MTLSFIGKDITPVFSAKDFGVILDLHRRITITSKTWFPHAPQNLIE